MLLHQVTYTLRQKGLPTVKNKMPIKLELPEEEVVVKKKEFTQETDKLKRSIKIIAFNLAAIFIIITLQVLGVI